MKISYLDAGIEGLCKQPKLATRKLGAESAKKLQRRLSELFAASAVTELPAGRPHALLRDRIGQYAVDLYSGRYDHRRAGGARQVFSQFCNSHGIHQEACAFAVTGQGADFGRYGLEVGEGVGK